MTNKFTGEFAADYLRRMVKSVGGIKAVLERWREMDVAQFSALYAHTAQLHNLDLAAFTEAFTEVIGLAPEEIQPDYTAELAETYM